MKKYAKFLLVLLLAVTAFQLSGLETAFCDDGSASQTTEAHDCMTCQSTHNSATLQQPAIAYVEFLATFFSADMPVVRLQQPIRFILRPPIAL